MEVVETKWQEILTTLKNEFDLSEVSFNAWIAPLKIHHIEGNKLVIPCEDQMTINYIAGKCLKPLKVVIEELTGINYDLVLLISSSIINKEETTQKNNSNEEIFELSGLKKDYTFEKFVIGSNNRFASSASLAVAESPGEVYNPLYIYGGPGLGKTHLMHSIGHYILEHNPNAKVIYVTSEEFTNEVIESIRAGNANAMTKLREKYRTVDVLMVDDVQFIIGQERTQEEFFHTFNALHSNGKQIILTSDKPPKDMETLEERIKSRFEWGLMADIGFPDYETRMAILRKKQESDGYRLPDDVLDYIATNIKSNIRELEGALNRLIAIARLSEKEITLAIATEELQNYINPDKPREITLQLIVEIVCDHFQIPMDQMFSKARSSDIAKPRMIAMYLANSMTNASQNAIGAFLGGRDHSTVIHGIKKIEKEITENEMLKKQIDIIKNKINPN